MIIVLLFHPLLQAFATLLAGYVLWLEESVYVLGN